LRPYIPLPEAQGEILAQPRKIKKNTETELKKGKKIKKNENGG